MRESKYLKVIFLKKTVYMITKPHGIFSGGNLSDAAGTLWRVWVRTKTKNTYS
ncbi:MAG: hypothetical protein JWR18_1342 [Segetibacter sp.]|jgi:hypothetical protein|nr:hypothetical protein [Segetibacter sp.]